MLEAQQLDGSFPQLPAASSSHDTETTVAVLQRATSAATEACEAALARCQRLCGGIELPSLALVADDRLAALLGDLQVRTLLCLSMQTVA